MSNDNGINDNQGGAEDGSEMAGGMAGGEAQFVSSEEKKPQVQIYVLVGMVLLAPMVIWYMYNRGGPDSAAAAIDPHAPISAVQTVHTFLDSGQEGVAAMRTMLNGTEKIVKQFLAYPSMAQIPLSDLKTNPFRAHDPVADDPEAAAKKKKEEEKAAIAKAVGELHLQSIMSGRRGACMINNSMYTEGQIVEGFTVEKIAQGVVTVNKGGFRFELTIQK